MHFSLIFLLKYTKQFERWCNSSHVFHQIHLGLLIFSLSGYLLPGYLFYHRRNLQKQKKTKRPSAQELLKASEANGHAPHSNGFAAAEA